MPSGEGKDSDIRGMLDWVDFKAPSSREPELSMWQRQPSTPASTAVKALLMWGVDRIYFLHCRSWGPLCVPGLRRFPFQQPAHGPFWRTACGLWNRLSCTCREPECQDFSHLPTLWSPTMDQHLHAQPCSGKSSLPTSGQQVQHLLQSLLGVRLPGLMPEIILLLDSLPCPVVGPPITCESLLGALS